MIMQLRTSSCSTGMRHAAADAALMAAGVLLLALAVWLLGGASAQRVMAHAAVMLGGVAALQIFTGNTGIVSFGHAAFMGLGAYATGILTMSAALQSTALPELPAWLAGHELSMPAALLAAALLGLLAGALSGTMLLRLNGASASIATLALLIIVYTVLAAARELTRGSQPFYGVPRNVGLWTAVTGGIVALTTARLFRETRWGLAARAASEDERGAAAAGVHAGAAAFVAWTLSAVIAALAGGLMAQFLGAFTPHTFYFDLSFTMLAMLLVGGMRSSLGALAGVAATSIVIELVRRLEGGGELAGIALPNLFGLTQAVLAIAMIVTIWRRPQGLFGNHELGALSRFRVRGARTPGRAHAAQAALADPSAEAPLDTSAAPVPAAPLVERSETVADVACASAAAQPARALASDDECLVAEKLTKRYAGLSALDAVSLRLAPDRITGIIGPNGAGKSTLVNLLSGHARATSGEVRLGAARLTNAPAHAMARAGIARTFQHIRVYPELSVLQNVLVAAREVQPGGLLEAERAAARELTALGLETYTQRPAGSLAPGLRRRLEIARALALRPRFLLLDEPAAGMNPVETAALAELLGRVRRERALGIVLIEHDLPLIMQLCERVIVLDRGRVIAEGTPAEVQGDPAVVAAYLGCRAAGGGGRERTATSPRRLSHA